MIVSGALLSACIVGTTVAEQPVATTVVEQPRPQPVPPATATGERQDPARKAGEPAPPFFLETLNPDAGNPRVFDLQSYVGDAPTSPRKAVLISFFATWCQPCRRELPALVALSRKYGPSGLQVVSISIDKEPDAIGQLPAFIRKNDVVHPVLNDPMNLLVRRYLGSSATLPSLVLVKADGTIASLRQGYEGDVIASLETELRPLLGLPPAEVTSPGTRKNAHEP